MYYKTDTEIINNVLRVFRKHNFLYLSVICTKSVEAQSVFLCDVQILLMEQARNVFSRFDSNSDQFTFSMTKAWESDF